MNFLAVWLKSLPLTISTRNTKRWSGNHMETEFSHNTLLNFYLSFLPNYNLSFSYSIAFKYHLLASEWLSMNIVDVQGTAFKTEHLMTKTILSMYRYNYFLNKYA